MRYLSAVTAATVVAAVALVLPATPAYAATLPTGARTLESVNSLGQLEPVTASSPAQTKADARDASITG